MTLHLIEPLGFSIDDRALRRAGLDYWEELSPIIWPDYATFLASVPPEAQVFLLTTKSEHCYWDASFKEGDYLVFGCETRGLPESLIANVGKRAITIPQIAGRSLNLATSVGIVLYEGLRQLRK